MIGLAGTNARWGATSLDESAAETIPPATHLEGWPSRMFANDPFSMSVLHDLRSPLASISTCAEMLTDLHVNPDHIKRLGRNIRTAADRIRELLASLIDTREANSTSAEICDLRDLLAAARLQAAAAADIQGVEILLDLPAGVDIMAVRTRLERVFVNLITNALEAMPRGGAIRIGARVSGKCTLIEVEDSGPGIPPEISSRVFDPFVTARKKDGLGLGLALSRRTILDHGGDIWIEPASGARFVIRLPVRRGPKRIR